MLFTRSVQECAVNIDLGPCFGAEVASDRVCHPSLDCFRCIVKEVPTPHASKGCLFVSVLLLCDGDGDSHPVITSHCVGVFCQDLVGALCRGNQCCERKDDGHGYRRGRVGGDANEQIDTGESDHSDDLPPRVKASTTREICDVLWGELRCSCKMH